MQVTVKSFATLRNVMESRLTQELNDGSTLSDLLTLLMERYPGLRDEIFEEGSRELQDYVNILVNGRNINFINGLDTELKDGDLVVLFPPAGGG
ncbi:MAG: MoaD family protein [Methanocalculus sp. MSAO_Arc1]|uniref:ubiquitin-like small modifier protein 1 n=1 Tax=Methanocalculus TaxID=71151 RepID=UPI000FF2CE66|nr:MULTISPECIES: ubiquitin-like small modifier protein 1 [unclassified Methanocalculus]MCP1662474.1 molybdopterin synthase sulfur carrier subunit [Methanocalculus sp. AMF5]RQD80818.1 MAG: MoaD family protein [Methanocalculus sp. MSAO_Arc1]